MWLDCTRAAGFRSHRDCQTLVHYGRLLAARAPVTHARAVPTYVLQAMALTHSGEPVVDSEEAWQRAHLPEGFAKFVYAAG
jgi:hypothetical protein